MPARCRSCSAGPSLTGASFYAQKDVDAARADARDGAHENKLVSLTLVFGLLSTAGCFAADAFAGTWKLNEKKSNIPRGLAHNRMVTYSNAFPFRTKVAIDGVDAHGKKFHSEWFGRFDGSDNEVTGDSSTETRAVKEVNDRTLNFWSKKGGKVVNSGTITVSADGKTRTVTINGTNAKGKKTHGRMVYDKA